MVVLDTSVIIDHLRQSNSNKETFLQKIAKKVSKQSIAISVITIQELYEGLSTRNSEKEQYLLSTIGPLNVLPYDYETAKKAGEIARDLNQPIEFADSAIAATCLNNQSKLATLNIKDFEKISGLELLKISA